jgi:phosphoglycerate dehydrogenase-like enzyme
MVGRSHAARNGAPLTSNTSPADSVGHIRRTTGRGITTATEIGILGDGNVGGALARGLKRVGRDVRAVGKEPGTIREAAS